MPSTQGNQQPSHFKYGELCMYYVNIHISFTLNLAVTKKTVGDKEKLLTYLNSALEVLLGLDIFPRVPKKKVKFCCPVLFKATERIRLLL